MELWIQAHLLTEHPWDVALRLEAMDLEFQGYLREALQKLTTKWMIETLMGVAPASFKGLRGLIS